MNARRFCLVDSRAAEDIVSMRALQSVDFEQGKHLALVLTGAHAPGPLSPHTIAVTTDDGLFFLHDSKHHDDFLVIDLEYCPAFDCSPRDALLRFQRLLRFACRRWQKLSPAISERLIEGSTKAAVFPYPITSQTSIRITVEMAPDRRRRERRAQGIELLAFRIGTDGGGGPKEEAPVTNFRKALDGLSQASMEFVRAQETMQKAAVAGIESLSVTRLKEGTVRGAIAGCNYDEWRAYLTEAQIDFVEQPLSSPHRIEGPAGTGKTLSLVLKCIKQLRSARSAGAEHRALFVAHSEATRRTIESMFAPELGDDHGSARALFELQSVKISTLHSLCGELLRYDISDTELLDRDAFESKQAQLLYTVEALQEVRSEDFSTHSPFLSPEFSAFFAKTDDWALAELIQHEISVKIKGRADEDLSRYKRLPRLKYGLPVECDGDKAFVFLIFRAYQKRLTASGQFDTDDIVLTALRQLDTPIWRRRRTREGYDSIFIDETHLFNINELSIFHRLTRTQDKFPIAYSADVAQSLGDRGWSDVEFDDALFGPEVSGRARSGQTVFRSIFRCAPEIVNLAFSVTSAAATLFTNFHDPLSIASSAFTQEEERKTIVPGYVLLPNDESMIEKSFELADRDVDEMKTTRGDVAIIVFGNELFSAVERFARTANKPVEMVTHRGDMEVVRRARASGRYVLSTPEFVGGLEFDGVILVGVDKGRVPPRFEAGSADSENFISYASHQRLYVAITRARFRVSILGVKARGPSPVFESALAHGLVELAGV